ncbi:flagellar assembly protein FliX [Acidiphilium acidophilum]|uniref:flagellar assembly protein FliX n=1 Tax=Acidiphilium acidophilum TaxID=76588 RepID=UPI002E8E7294|nr:flagellar assembly protein FliX [Acidiphilium acidophilum]
MTRITGLGRISAIRNAKGTAQAVAGGFRVTEGGSALPLAATSPLGGLLAVQEVCGSQTRDRAAQLSGETVLGALGGLQAASMAGNDGQALAHLHDAVGAMIEPDDPALRRIIGAIRLRARVELARYRAIGAPV